MSGNSCLSFWYIWLWEFLFLAVYKLTLWQMIAYALIPKAFFCQDYSIEV
jgi:hypothetical protein